MQHKIKHKHTLTQIPEKKPVLWTTKTQGIHTLVVFRAINPTRQCVPVAVTRLCQTERRRLDLWTKLVALELHNDRPKSHQLRVSTRTKWMTQWASACAVSARMCVQPVRRNDNTHITCEQFTTRKVQLHEWSTVVHFRQNATENYNSSARWNPAAHFGRGCVVQKTLVGNADTIERCSFWVEYYMVFNELPELPYTLG